MGTYITQLLLKTIIFFLNSKFTVYWVDFDFRACTLLLGVFLHMVGFPLFSNDQILASIFPSSIHIVQPLVITLCSEVP